MQDLLFGWDWKGRERSPWWALGPLSHIRGVVPAIEPEREGRAPIGCVYAIDFGDGLTKIGCSRNPAVRISQLASHLETYGGRRIGTVAVSRPATLFRLTEKRVHHRFRLRREMGELFSASIDIITPALCEMPLAREAAPITFIQRDGRKGYELVPLAEMTKHCLAYLLQAYGEPPVSSLYCLDNLIEFTGRAFGRDWAELWRPDWSLVPA